MTSPTILALLLTLGPHNMRSEDLPLADLSSWISTGTAFSKGPATGELIRTLEIESNRTGTVISSEIDGDAPTGTLTSPEFRIERKYIAFLVGGGDYERDTCVDLLIDGKVVKSATGRNNDRLDPQSWNVEAWRGKQARIQVVDRATGDWGHVNVDAIVQTDHPVTPPVAKGTLYRESLRPQFHFTARQWTMDRLNPRERQEGWINDLNGLIYYDGEYHLFAQRWAKCWLHAVSHDLIHWQELEPAFWEENLDSGAQSGTCVVDYQNTSGLGKDAKHPPLVAFWSRFDNRSQCISYSLDHGRTWKLYDKNPLMDRPERDPKVFWYAPGKHWVMILYGEGQYHILTSKDLLSWTDEHHPIPDSFECPDFFELPIDGDAQSKKWVLIQGNGQYSVGTFDGRRFTEETKRFPCDVGPNFYATQSWANVETGDGRRIQVAWMRGANFPDMPFNQMISFPCELTLHSTPKGLRVFRQPIREIAKLHAQHRSWNDQRLDPGEKLSLDDDGSCVHVKAEVSVPAGAKLAFDVRGVPVVGVSSVRSIEMLIDRTSIEVFLNHGEMSSTSFVLPTGQGLSVYANGGSVAIKSLDVWKLNSVWSM